MAKKGGTIKLRWKCHTPNLLKEVLANPSTYVLRIPIAQFGRMLHEVAERASQIHDKRLDALMMGLTLYDIADPEKKETFNQEIVDEYTKFLTENPIDKAPTYAQMEKALRDIRRLTLNPSHAEYVKPHMGKGVTCQPTQYVVNAAEVREICETALGIPQY